MGFSDIEQAFVWNAHFLDDIAGFECGDFDSNVSPPGEIYPSFPTWLFDFIISNLLSDISLSSPRYHPMVRD